MFFLIFSKGRSLSRVESVDKLGLAFARTKSGSRTTREELHQSSVNPKSKREKALHRKQMARKKMPSEAVTTKPAARIAR